MNKGLKNELLFLMTAGAAALFVGRQRKTAAALGVAAGAWALMKQPNPTDFRGKTALITGGSRGLGLALAENLVKQGARVTLLARDTEELELAKQHLVAQKTHADVHIYPCDVTKPEEVELAIQETVERWGGLDLLINNAGAIIVGPFDSMTPEDFEVQMKLHLFANIYATKAALPYFRNQKQGRIINICSMGGKMAVPHMLPYDTSKFALAGFSQGLAVELASENIVVTTVYPTLMKTGSPIQAVFKGNAEKEFSWFTNADNLPGLSMRAEVAAEKILQASLDKRTELIPSNLGKIRQGFGAFFPETVNGFLMLLNSLMPKGKRMLYRTGAQAETDSTYLPGLAESAHASEEQWNQQGGTDPKKNLGYDRRH